MYMDVGALYSILLELVFTKATPALFMKGLILLDVKQCDAIKHKG